MYPVACQSDPAFNAKYGGLTDETQQMKALVESDWMFAEEGRLYREEILSVLCAKKIVPVKPRRCNTRSGFRRKARWSSRSARCNAIAIPAAGSAAVAGRYY